MSTIDHHPLPRLSAVTGAELWAAALAVRYVWVSLGLFISVTLFGLSDPTGEVSPPVFAPQLIAAPAAFLALVMSVAVWNREEPAKRGYFHSMPVGRFRHHLSRNLAGWVWTMLGTALLHLWGAGAHLVTNARLGDFPVWQWAVPAVVATATYLVVATVSTAFNHLIGWIVFAYLASPFLFRIPLFQMLKEGRYGVASLVGGIGEGSTGPTLAVWLTTVVLWITIPMLALFVAARVHRDV